MIVILLYQTLNHLKVAKLVRIIALAQVEDCIQPACFTKDLCVVIISRDSRFSPSM